MTEAESQQPQPDGSPAEAERTMTSLAAAGELDRLEEVWLDQLEALGDLNPFVAALETLVRKGEFARTSTLVTLLAEALSSEGRNADVIRAIQPVVRTQRTGKEVAVLRPLVLNAIAGMYGDEEWFPLFLQMSGIESSTQIGPKIEEFQALLGYRPGSAVIHYRENRPGKIETMDPETSMCLVRFSNGTERNLSLEVCQELLSPLDAEDWRALLMTHPEEVRLQALESPAQILRNVARSHGGRVTSPQIKTALFGQVIPESKWNSWWKRAKDEATREPFLAVEGTRARPVFVLRERPLTLDEEAIREVRWARGLAESVMRARQYRREKISEETALEIVKEICRRLEAGQSAVGSDDPGVRLEAALAVEEWGGSPPVEASSILKDAMDDEPDLSDERLAKVFSTIPSREGRQAAFRRIREMLPEAWSGRILGAAGGFTGSVVEETISLLLDEGLQDKVTSAFRGFLDTPFRNREMVIYLTGVWSRGTLGTGLSPSDLFDSILPLSRDLARPPRGEKIPPRLLRGLVGLLVGGRKPLIIRILDDSTAEDVQRWCTFADTAPDLPWEFTEAVRARAPSRETDEALSFWQGEAIFCTEEGIARRREELRVLVEEKIPANRKALGEAASHGDLSENAEWSAAIEEQQSLAEQSRIMEEEMAKAMPLESQPRPEGVVAPGVRCSYRDEGTGVEHHISILGPWDEGEDAVSYRAPLAQGLLGKKVGDLVHLELPGGAAEVTIQGIEPIL
ncbi:MAG: GreA/GreB family elongation factor [Planctomycetota bacterium]|nr:GreA/GreB family elongation factor [Planctomycetota bacterium]